MVQVPTPWDQHQFRKTFRRHRTAISRHVDSTFQCEFESRVLRRIESTKHESRKSSAMIFQRSGGSSQRVATQLAAPWTPVTREASNASAGALFILVAGQHPHAQLLLHLRPASASAPAPGFRLPPCDRPRRIFAHSDARKCWPLEIPK